MLTQALADALVEAEKIIRTAPHVRTEQDVAEGLDYLGGSIRAALASSWGRDKDFPYFIRSATPYMKVGLDNPDTLYFSARIREGAEYLVTGRRGETTDLSFQILNGDYTPADVPDSLNAFDDREIAINPDGTFELRFGPPRDDADPNYFVLGPKAAMLLVREVWSDWTARPGTAPGRRPPIYCSLPASCSVRVCFLRKLSMRPSPCNFQAATECCPATVRSAPTIGGWDSRSATTRLLIGPEMRIHRAPTAISGNPAPSCGWIPRRGWRAWR